MKTVFVIVFALLTGSASAEILDEEQLTQAILKLPHTRLTPATARQLVSTVLTVTADTDLDPAILLAQAYIESRFDPTATSRLIDGKRQTGPWPSRQAPPGWTKTLYCGVAQTVAVTWGACLALRDTRLAIRRQAAELGRWLVRADGDLTRSLGGFGCGNLGLTGKCNRYPQRVQALAKKLRANVRPLS